MEVKFGAGQKPVSQVAPDAPPAVPWDKAREQANNAAIEQAAKAVEAAEAEKQAETDAAEAEAQARAKGQVPAARPQYSLGPSGLVLGDKLPTFDEIILPRVNISQNIGQLKESFPPGSIVYNQGTALFIPPVIKDGQIVRATTPVVNMTVLGFRPTRYVEKVKGGAKGMICNTVDQVAENGGTLDYQEWQLKEKSGIRLFQYYADALVAIRCPDWLPEEQKSDFSYEVEGKFYTLAMWGMKGTIYTEAAKRVFFTARATGYLRKGGYPSYSFGVATKEKDYPGNNKSWVPVCRPAGPNTEVFLDFVRQILNAPVREAQPE